MTSSGTSREPTARAGKFDLIRQWVRNHPAPRFAIIGGLAVVLDVGLLRLLHGTLGVPLLVSTAAAYAVAAVPSFLLNRHWAFRDSSDGVAHQQAGRFMIAIVANLVSTLVIVGSLSWIGVYYLLAKVIAIVINAVGNFFAFRHWVFPASEGRPPDAE